MIQVFYPRQTRNARGAHHSVCLATRRSPAIGNAIFSEIGSTRTGFSEVFAGPRSLTRWPAEAANRAPELVGRRPMLQWWETQDSSTHSTPFRNLDCVRRL